MGIYPGTELTHSLLMLEKKILGASEDIERWLEIKWQEHTPPFYGSVDLRNSGFKLAPVDMNLFPGGFNNLTDDSLPVCAKAAKEILDKLCPKAKSVLLIPENHTRNLFYLQNVAYLITLLRQAGLEVRIGSLFAEVTFPVTTGLPSGFSFLLEPLVRKDGHLKLADFDPCLILLNNDLSAGIPEILKDIEGQSLLPPLHAGWALRRKSNHFAAYDEVTEAFAQLISIDPWLINPYFSVCNHVNFHERQGEECLSANVDAVLQLVREKYREYGVDKTPFVVVKADAGTYGMGVMTVKDASEIVGLNRKQRNKMSVIKEGLNVSQVIVQEGVHTCEQVGNSTAEPVVYMIGRHVVGGFYRIHPNRGIDENLNAPGMTFKPFDSANSCSLPDRSRKQDETSNRFYVYGVIARLEQLAAAVELEKTAGADCDDKRQ